MKTCASYVAAAKVRLGNPTMSDRELGEKLGGFVQSNVARAKSGYMTDPMAMSLANVLEIDAGEVLMVARLEREKDPAVKEALQQWAGKIFASALSIAALAVALTLGSFPSPADAAGSRSYTHSVQLMSTKRDNLSGLKRLLLG